MLTGAVRDKEHEHLPDITGAVVKRWERIGRRKEEILM